MNITTVGVWGGYPKANGATSSFLIEENGFHLLFDCGSGVLASLQNYLPLEKLDAVVISHYHADHIADIGSLQYSRLINYYTGNPMPALPIYGHKEDAEQFEKLTYKGQTEALEITGDSAVRIGPFLATFCPTIHPVYCLAMKLRAKGKTVVFTADSEWSDELAAFAEGADLLVSEANLHEEHIGKSPGHMAGSEAGQLADEAGAERLILTHLPQYGSLEEIREAAASRFTGPVELAAAGKTYTV